MPTATPRRQTPILRRVDDRRMNELSESVLRLDERLDKLEARINLLFGALGVIIVLANAGVAIVIAQAVK